MKKIRKEIIDKASTAKKWGLILGTLGRQGNTKVMENLKVSVACWVIVISFRCYVHICIYFKKLLYIFYGNVSTPSTK